MLAFLGLPKSYITAPKARGQRQGQPWEMFPKRNAEEGLTLRRQGVGQAMECSQPWGLKQKLYSEGECSVENKPCLSPCFVLGAYQGEPLPCGALDIEFRARHSCQTRPWQSSWPSLISRLQGPWCVAGQAEVR